jgi:predicted dehydrogenase
VSPDRIGLAVVGAGYWGRNLVRNARACADADLRFVCDVDTERAQAVLGRYSTVAVVCDLEPVLDDPEVRGVAIATPAATHADLAIACLERGKHVLVEKPLASSVREAEKILAKASELGLHVMCDHTYCYTPAVQRIRQLVRGGEIGDIQYVDSVRINLGLVQPDVDVFWDLGPHDLSILDFILPDGCEPVAVSAYGADPMGVGRACIGYLTVPLTGGAVAHAHVNWLSPTKIRTTVIGGSRRTVVWDDLSPGQRLSVYDRGVDLPVPDEREARRAASVSYRLGDMHAPALPEVEALQLMLTEFVASIREDRPALTGGDAGLRVLRLLEAASQSTQHGRVIALDGSPS